MTNKTAKYILLLAFIISVTLRFFLCSNGGQFFFVDEARFMNGHYLLAHISDGDWTSAVKRITTTYAHTLFIFISAILEGLRYLYVLLFINSNAPAFLLSDSRIAIKVAAFLLSITSAMNIILLYIVVKRSGGTNLQGVIASLILAISTTNLYFSRHLLPYDISISFALIALIFALNKRNSSIEIILCGLFCGFTTLTYNGYWTLSGLVWIIMIFKSSNNLTKRIQNGLISLTAGVLPVIILQIISLQYEYSFLAGMKDWLIATKANQYGDTGIGWKILLSYLWESEGIVAILYFASIAYSFHFFIKNKKFELNNKDIGFFSIIFLTLILISLCDIFKTSVLYGRTIKQTIPFFSIAISYPVACLIKNCSSLITKRFLYIFILIFGAQISYNFKSCIDLIFPIDFILKASSYQKEFSHLTEIDGPNISKLEYYSSNTRHAVVNAHGLIPPFIDYKFLPLKNIILEAKHPYIFKPYQYIHYQIDERTMLRNLDLKMKLVELDLK